jgi:hypothetical protein
MKSARNPMIDYDHSLNLHTLEGPRAAFPEIFRDGILHSLVDVGCGTGTWLKAAIEAGVKELMGVDGVAIPPGQLLVPSDCFQVRDFTSAWDLGRRFDAVLCLEVAEHLDQRHAGTLVDALTRHSDMIVFSAACPGQPGQHHVNCQWPAYWQQLFNDRGYVCSDDVRWRIWEIEPIEPWYKQNIFIARHAPQEAGKEPRIPPVIHPKMVPWFQDAAAAEAFGEHVQQIEGGRMRLSWYLTAPFWVIGAVCAKLKRKLR